MNGLKIEGLTKMPPKKREKDADVSKYIGRDQMQDHELFLQAFEKPTQIYRYLRTRNSLSPVFLHRTLTYMKHRNSRSNKQRSSFKVDSMLMDRINKNRIEKSMGYGDYMTLMFLGFFDKSLSLEYNCDLVRVEAILLKITHKKRKDSLSTFMQVNIGSCDVHVNPTNQSDMVPAICIPSESFKPVGTPQNISYILLLRVETLQKANSTDTAEEPVLKRPKTTSKLYGSDLVIIDRYSRCQLADGDYELPLEEVIATVKNYSPKKPSSWEVIPDESIVEVFNRLGNQFEKFSKCPTLKFCLKWTNEPSSSHMQRPKRITPKDGNVLVEDKNQDKDVSTIHTVNNNNNNNINNNNNNNNSIKNGRSDRNDIKDVVKFEEPIQILYQFIYNNNSRQQTEACADMHCPWCGLDCIMLYSLLKHLKLCHARFTFTYAPAPNGARIDVAINDMFDGSYTGSPHDLVGPSGCAFARTGPVRRTIVTHLLVCRPRRQKPNLVEFQEQDETELNNQRPYITGHNRLYHHTETCLPVHPKELDIDSEGESDPLWLQHKTMQMIDEFTDVNEGEKELMKMWNLHVMKHGYVGDCQLPIACDMFLDIRGKELLQKNLYRNFVLHMCSLFDYGLVSPEVVYKTIQKLQTILSTYPEGRKVLSESREQQLDYWLKVGKQKQAQLEEQKQQKQQFQQLPKQQNEGKTCHSSNTAKTLQYKNQKMAGEIRKLMNSDKDKLSERSKETSKDTKSVNGDSAMSNISTIKRRSITSQMSTSVVSSEKRRFSQLRESPPRRRSAPSTDQPKNQPTRRKSAIFAAAVSQNSSMRKRISLPVAKAEKH